MSSADDITRLEARLAQIEAERARLLAELRRHREAPASPETAPASATKLSTTDKIALFRSLFRGRDDVFAQRWESRKTGRSGYAPVCANEWVRGVCEKPTVSCADCRFRAFVPLADDIVIDHIRGRSREGETSGTLVIGVYPMLGDNTCWFLATDFDGEGWQEDALAYVHTCRLHGITPGLERSRSGDGAHVWIFFAKAVDALTARRLGDVLLTQTMDRRPEIGFASYDRLFPSQDFVAPGGFGNLIALPFQHAAREKGNSVFVDDELNPHADQWGFLASLRRVSPDEVGAILDRSEAWGRGVGVRMPVDDENADEPWLSPPSRSHERAAITAPLPERVRIVLADEAYIDRTGLPSQMVALLVRLAAFHNPEFFRAQAMRMSTYGKPRIVSCAELHPRHVGMPRGCLDDAIALLREHGIEPDVIDRREMGVEIAPRFRGALRTDQIDALHAMARHDFGVLAATTGFGKTVIAAALIALRRRNTLIVVHRRELQRQWTERLIQFLDIAREDIGTIGGGRREPTGKIDVAVVQSLVKRGEVSDIIGGYGHLVIDECHHVSATSVELVARRSKARYVLGLSATVTRKDGHHPIIFMQCGPTRHKVDPRKQAAKRGFAHRVVQRETSFVIHHEGVPITSVYAALAHDEGRNALIVADVLRALQAGRFPIVLTERREHLRVLEQALAPSCKILITLHGGLGAKQRRSEIERLQATTSAPRVLLATGRYLGEGFDDARSDTLFLTMPVSWKGTLAQYVGRLHREHDAKSEVIVYDYIDARVPVLTRMAARRIAGYKALGYTVE